MLKLFLLSIAALVGFNLQSSAPAPNDFGLVWVHVTDNQTAPVYMGWVTFVRPVTMPEVYEEIERRHARPVTYMEMDNAVAQYPAQVRGVHLVAIGSFANRSANETVVRSVTAAGEPSVERLDTRWPPGTVFLTAPLNSGRNPSPGTHHIAEAAQAASSFCPCR